MRFVVLCLAIAGLTVSLHAQDTAENQVRKLEEAYNAARVKNDIAGTSPGSDCRLTHTKRPRRNHPRNGPAA